LETRCPRPEPVEGRSAPQDEVVWTDFCLIALVDAARRTIAKLETLILSETDGRAFFEALINPPKPSGRLVRAQAADRPVNGRAPPPRALSF
jgi:uncharacterized protein (DUF1778 family)